MYELINELLEVQDLRFDDLMVELHAGISLLSRIFSKKKHYLSAYENPSCYLLRPPFSLYNL